MRDESSLTFARVSMNRTSEAIVSEVILGISMVGAKVVVVVRAGGVGVA